MPRQRYIERKVARSRTLYAVDIWSLGIVALELAYGLPEAGSEVFNPKVWYRQVSKVIQALDPDELIGFLSGSMLQLQPKRRLSASECLEKVLGIKRAVQTTSPSRSYLANSTTSTEKASLLTTLMWASKDGCKRQRSPDSNFHAELNRRTAVRKEYNDRNTAICSQTYAISNTSLLISDRQSTMYESVLELLRDMHNGLDSGETTDSHTTGLVQTLCHQLERLKIAEIKTNTDDAERTILTAVTEAREFTLASLTSSDLANSVADLAEHLSRLMQLYSPDPQTLSESAKKNRSSDGDLGAAISPPIGPAVNETDRAKVVSFQTASVSGTTRRNGEETLPTSGMHTTTNHVTTSLTIWPTDASGGLSTASSDYAYGLTFPSALLDPIDVSGCAPPMTLQ